MVLANTLVFATYVSEDALIVAQGNCCFYCERKRRLTRDHLIPRKLGRSLALNKVMACEKCNTKKGSRLPTSDEVSKARALYRQFGVPAWAIG